MYRINATSFSSASLTILRSMKNVPWKARYLVICHLRPQSYWKYIYIFFLAAKAWVVEQASETLLLWTYLRGIISRKTQYSSPALKQQSGIWKQSHECYGAFWILCCFILLLEKPWHKVCKTTNLFRWSIPWHSFKDYSALNSWGITKTSDHFWQTVPVCGVPTLRKSSQVCLRLKVVSPLLQKDTNTHAPFAFL